MGRAAKDVKVLKTDPFNAETALERQEGVITPVERFYVRNHFPVPERWDGLRVGGEVETPLTLGLDELRALPSRTLTVTLECAGNGRVYMQPPAPGVQWGLGAVATAEWTGAPLGELLDRARVRPNAVEIRFHGADAGKPEENLERVNYGRSLALSQARREDVLLVWGMNGEPLLPEHGAPLRLLVPGWYGMASVKWLNRIDAVAEPYRGYYQATHYVFDDARRRPEPLGTMAPRALITSPGAGETVASGRPRYVHGYAWSGAGPVTRVEVSTDGGPSWRDAELAEAASPYAWREWQATWTPPIAGRARLLARATDAAGRRQPEQAPWNRLGYVNNSIREVVVEVA